MSHELRVKIFINNINRFLQESNPNPSVTWGIQQYKIGDPILFNDSDRFSPVIYNNMKGKVVGIQVFDEDDISGYIQFDIELNKIINGLDAMGYDFELLENSENGNSIIRFIVNKLSSEPIIAIILDRGVGGNDIDLLTESQEFATKSVGRVRNLNFEVLREGWN